MKKVLYLTMLAIVILATSCSKVEDQLSDAAYLDGISSSIQTISLPTSVTDLVVQQYPNYAIVSTEMSNTGGKYRYHVNIESSTEQLTLTYDNQWGNLITERGHKGQGGGNDPNGKKHPKDSTRTPIKLEDLCQGAKDYAAANYAGYELKKALKRDSSGVITYIVLLVKAGTQPVALVFDADCNFIKVADLPFCHGKGGHGKGHGKGTPVDITTIPTTVTDFLATTYSGFTISKAALIEGKGDARYVVEIVNGTEKKVLVFDKNWVFVKEL
jgi:uncharacterized membrane protein YkoI